jgi:Sec-independent protein translocase protein TatA
MIVMDDRHQEVGEFRQKLRELDAEFDREMRARGFDPDQAENVALPSHLAALYAEREQIKAALEESEEKTDDRN